MWHELLCVWGMDYFVQENEGLELLKTAKAKVGYMGNVVIGMDVGASKFYDNEDKTYDLNFKEECVEKAIEEKTNSLFLKVNQIGFVTESIEVVKIGETDDTFIADLSIHLPILISFTVPFLSMATHPRSCRQISKFKGIIMSYKLLSGLLILPPIIYGDVSHPKAFLIVFCSTMAQEMTKCPKKVKGIAQLRHALGLQVEHGKKTLLLHGTKLQVLQVEYFSYVSVVKAMKLNDCKEVSRNAF
ncbi:hypothetical protein L6452_37285 [Arctium lappa]|uniref:Uncharacterized protein n=1 Tax=Arctium lappa TaxID=4217 RepID=A0ACB8Y397_ARCLA|nr:hypothetical protein L6452_37285 [Arctium lappa]